MKITFNISFQLISLKENLHEILLALSVIFLSWSNILIRAPISLVFNLIYKYIDLQIYNYVVPFHSFQIRIWRISSLISKTFLFAKNMDQQGDSVKGDLFFSRSPPHFPSLLSL